MVKVSIHYDKEQYAPGDTVLVRIDVRLHKSPLEICSIRCSVVGCALVKWKERETSEYCNKTKTLSSTHTYFSLSEVLLMAPMEKKSLYLAVGQHSYEYKFTLPLSCDSTYDNGFGKIKYKCMVEIVRPVFKWNIRAKE
ncbi:hypothetical protein PENTCL1PPCAC_14185, partial [Pristionchus entomophagus]